jgi:hypothetical protein
MRGYTECMRSFVSMFSFVLVVIIALAAFMLVAPKVQAAPFGGQASTVIPCYNQVIWAMLGPPIGGPHIWSAGTVTYLNGPPRHAGQWILGLNGAPYFCIVEIQPLIVFAGKHITMMGSSQ